jgi:hypothetical protein
MRRAAERQTEIVYETIGDVRARAQETTVISEVLREESGMLVSRFHATRAEVREAILRRRELTRS